MTTLYLLGKELPPSRKRKRAMTTVGETVYNEFVVILLLVVSLGSLVTEVSAAVEIVSRERWGARKSKGTEPIATPVPHIFIHHTAMGECSDFESCKRMMQSIQNFHMDDRGWDDIGYNFLIGGDGRAYEGRSWNRVGAHTYGYNRDAIAFSLMGDFSNKSPSELMLNTTKKMIEHAENDLHVTGDYELHGHRDAGCTECPGSALYSIIEKWPHFKKGPLPRYKC